MQQVSNDRKVIKRFPQKNNYANCVLLSTVQRGNYLSENDHSSSRADALQNESKDCACVSRCMCAMYVRPVLWNINGTSDDKLV